jgi:hypothetical protein
MNESYNLELKKANEDFQRAVKIREELTREPSNEQKLDLYA